MEISRTCVGCGTVQDKKNMLRFVRNAQGQIVYDENKRMNGRGAYICPNKDCLERAAKKRGFARAFKCSITSDDLKEFSELFISKEA